jgi:hypothetical protein
VTSRLETAYQETAERIPDYTSAGRVISAARRRRTGRVAGTVVLAAALMIGSAVVAADSGLFDRLIDVAPAPGSEAAVEPIAPMEDWAPPSKVLAGAPPKVGTLIYRACTGRDCAIYLLRPDRTAFRLSDVRPDLAAKLRKYGFEGAALSYDAQYLGLRVGTGYEIHHLTQEKSVHTFEPGPPGSHWEVVGWGTASLNVTLAEYQGKRIIRYALLGLSISEYGLVYYRPPAGLGVLPVGHRGDRVNVAEPVDTSLPVADRPRLTRRALGYIVLAGTLSEPQGDDGGGIEEFDDLSMYMRAGETLAGPRGVPEMSCPPLGRGRNEFLSYCLTTVFSVRDGRLLPTAVVHGGWGGSGARIDVPTSDSRGEWTFVAPLTDDGIAVTRSTAGSAHAVDLVQKTMDGDRRVLHRLPAGAQVLLPGMTSPL